MMDVVSLFAYEEIRDFLLTKHTPVGFRVYKYFAKRHIRSFLQRYSSLFRKEKVYLIGIDEYVDNGYSHTAVLSHYGACCGAISLPGKLLAGNRVDYAGRSIQFRIENPRNFKYSGPENIDAILVDDIVTTGFTLQEAQRVLSASGVDVLFALTLADASR